MAAVRHPNRLPLQPLTAVAVLRSAEKPEIASVNLARLVEIDPALSAMVLRVANAPLFGFGGRVASARQASVMLGTRTVGSLAVGATASLVFGTEDGSTGEPPATHGCWSHAVTTACTTAVVARFLSVNPEEAFTAGLLHNAAWLVPGTVECAEGCDAETSSELLRDWGLPTSLVRAVRAHGSPPAATSDPLSRALAIGHVLAPVVEGPTPQLLAAAREALQAGGIASARLDEILGSVRRELESIVALVAAEAP
jgi:HD-like signal output (HDOD) protein